jgi:colanic acid/amylovoran biosynthesis glycosyltransferase
MKILFVVEHFPCVSETFVLNQVTGLIDRGHEVEVYPIGKPVSPVVHPDFEQYRLQEHTWFKPEIPANKLHRLLRALKFLPRCLMCFPRATLQSLNVFRYGLSAANLYLYYTLLPFLDHSLDFDIIHCHFGDKGVLARLWKDWGVIRSPVTVVFHAHEIASLSDEQGRAVYGRLLASDALLMPISQLWRERLLSWGARPDRTLVHRMGVDCEQIRFAPKSVTAGVTVQLLSVSRLTEMKGLEFAIRAVAQLKPRFPNFRYTVAGDGPLKQYLDRLTAELGVSNVVDFVGPQSQDKVRKLLREAHIFLCPSVIDSSGCMEGIPVALMETMAAGVPAVATFHSGIPELINDGVSGLLVAERDVNGLASAIEKLINNPEHYAAIAKNGRAKVECEFNIRKLNEQLERLFTGEMKT